MSVFIIAECGSTWRFGDDLSNAYRLIDAVKTCGADAAKFQWCSNTALMAKRRNAPELAPMYEKYLAYPREWLEKLKARCDGVGVEFMCTTYIPEDISVVAPLVKGFKVSSFESADVDFIEAHIPFDKFLIISYSCGARPRDTERPWVDQGKEINRLLCLSAYPAPVEQMNLKRLRAEAFMCGGEAHLGVEFDGLSDHTTSTLTGAVAVGCGAEVIEKHVRLLDTPAENPDYGHSLEADGSLILLGDPGKPPGYYHSPFKQYVQNVREAETLMGDGKMGPQPCEVVNMKYKVNNG